MPLLFFRFIHSHLHYNGSSLDCPSPRDIVMSTSRPSSTPLHLTLDEQSFQGLLSAAFTIQEHNDRRQQEQSAEPISRPMGPIASREEREEQNEPQPQTKQAEQRAGQSSEAPVAGPPEPQAPTACPHCGALKASNDSTCAKCGLDQFRPGERLQRNWASMWLRSQKQGLWPERSSEVDELPPNVRRGFSPIAPAIGANRPPHLPSAQVREAHAETGLIRGRANGHEPVDRSALASARSQVSSGRETTPEVADHVPQILESSVRNEFFTNDASTFDTLNEATLDPGGDPVDDPSAIDSVPKSLLQQLSQLNVTVRFHRADLYLGIAVFVAALALLWPTGAAPRRASLGPWERALITLGIAEAPAPPVVHLQGDPGIQVWVDPHSALYFCPGEEQFGKTTDGHFTSQREAQMDRFQPAGRSVCE